MDNPTLDLQGIHYRAYCRPGDYLQRGQQEQIIAQISMRTPLLDSVPSSRRRTSSADGVRGAFGSREKACSGQRMSRSRDQVQLSVTVSGQPILGNACQRPL